MRIYSQFKDYYDHVRSFGIDPLLVYERKQRIVMPEDLQYLPAEDDVNFIDWHGMYDLRLGSMSTYSHKNSPNVEKMLIGFCGKPYPVVRVEGGFQQPDEFVYDATRVEQMFPAPKSWKRFGKRWRSSQRTDGEKLAGFLKREFPITIETFVELKAPVFVVRQEPEAGHRAQRVVITNCCLKDLQFFRVVDPVTAFQEISMFVGNFLFKKDDPKPIPDKYLIAEKGFDENSFRHPTRVKDLI